MRNEAYLGNGCGTATRTSPPRRRRGSVKMRPRGYRAKVRTSPPVLLHPTLADRCGNRRLPSFS
jgi:hypothetical protein